METAELKQAIIRIGANELFLELFLVFVILLINIKSSQLRPSRKQ